MGDSSLSNDSSFRIHHTMLPVADIERSIDFYTRFLGMKPMGRRRDDSRRVEVAHVGYGDRDTQPSLELTQNIAENAPAEIGATGIHIALQVNGIEVLCQRLAADGVEFIQAVKATANNKRLTAWIRDPDRHAIEIIELR